MKEQSDTATSSLFDHWLIDSYCPDSVPSSTDKKLTVLLLSYKRIRNMEPIVRSLLRCECIGKIILSNNNPEYRIREWVTQTSDRLVCIDQTEHKGCAERYEIAKEEDVEYFCSIDDDIFLYPQQVTLLFEHLIRNPSVVHGIFGQKILDIDAYDPKEAFVHSITNTEESVDFLSQVLFFTRDHLRRYHETIRALYLDTPEGMRSLTWADDMVLSMSGNESPRCHTIGQYATCTTESTHGIALWVTPGFFHYRRQLCRHLIAFKNGLPPGDPEQIISLYHRREPVSLSNDTSIQDV